MKIGIDTFSFQVALEAGRYDVFATLDRLEALGLSGLQININGPAGRFLGGDPSDDAHVRKVRQAVEAREFFVEVGGRSTEPEMLEWQLRLAADLGADTLRTLVVYEESLEHTMAVSRRNLEKSLPLAESMGVRIALENHEDITAAELLKLLEDIDHPFLGACLDSGNDLSVFEEPVDAAQLLSPRAASTHIKDQKLIRVGDQVYSVGVPLETGDVDLPTILDIIARASPLDRILVQDTLGYAAPLNPFQRGDLKPVRDYAEVPTYPDRAAAEADGYYLNWTDLEPDTLAALADRKDQAIDRDIAYVRSLIG